MNWLKGLVLPLVKNLIKSNVSKLDVLEPKFAAVLVAKAAIPAENADAVAKALVDLAQAEVVLWIDKI